MKKCPNCQNTYDDSLKFCQKDGTPLVAVAEDAPKEDPLKTTVGENEGTSRAPEEKKPEPEPEIDPFKTMVAGAKTPPPKEDDVLEVPAEPVDPMATMVSGGRTAGKIDVDIPGGSAKEPENKEPEPPKAPEPPKPEAPKPPPAPPKASKPAPPADDKPASPIPSPFDESMPPGFQAPSTPPFETPESPVKPEPAAAPEAPKAQSLPTDFDDVDDAAIEPPVAGSVPALASDQAIEPGDGALENAADGPNQTMSYVSLGLGILSMLCCFSIVTGPAAVITGFMARGKANNDPEAYGGGGLALVGMILGVIGTILFIVLIVLQFFLGAFANLGRGF